MAIIKSVIKGKNGRYLLGTTDGIFYSDDSLNWEQDPKAQNMLIDSFEEDEETGEFMAIITDRKISYLSHDNGITWDIGYLNFIGGLIKVLGMSTLDI